MIHKIYVYMEHPYEDEPQIISQIPMIYEKTVSILTVKISFSLTQKYVSSEMKLINQRLKGIQPLDPEPHTMYTNLILSEKAKVMPFSTYMKAVLNELKFFFFRYKDYTKYHSII